jgi:uncharacterized phiE125 gp8 family phage protein
MAQQLITPPAVLPVTISDAKIHERISIDDVANDASIESMLYTATRLAEEYTNRAFITQTWKYVTTRLTEYIELPRPRLQSVTSITMTDINDTTTTIDPTRYFINSVYEPGRVFFKPGAPFNLPANWLWGLCYGGWITVTYVVGYGDNGDDVPAPIKEAILQTFGHLYENRESQDMPCGAKQILDPFRVLYI